MKIVLGAVMAASLSLAAAGMQVASAASLSRAQVESQLQQAQSEGMLIRGDADPYPVPTQQKTFESRAQVLSQLAQARSAGTLDYGDSDPYPQVVVAAASDPMASRSEVLAQLAQYDAAPHHIPSGR